MQQRRLGLFNSDRANELCVWLMGAISRRCRRLSAGVAPYESMHVAADWFDNADINENTREMIGRTNAQRLFGLKH